MGALSFTLLAVFVLIISGAVPGQEEKPPKPDPKKVAKEIDGILYSDLDKDKMLAKLKPYVAVMDSEADFKKKTGLGLGFGFGSGSPPVMHYNLLDCGLQLVIDPYQRIQIIRRSKKKIGEKEYPEMSISANSFTWKGYSRSYGE